MNRVDVVELRRALSDARGLAAALGLDVQPGRRGAPGVLVSCPWHDDATPSCSISPGHDGTLRVHCFGCGATGDALTLIAEARRLDLRHAFAEVLEEAARIAQMPMVQERSSSSHGRRDASAGRGVHPRAREGVREIARVILHLGRLDDSAISVDTSAYLRRRGLLADARESGLAALPDEPFQATWSKLLRDALGRELVGACGMLRRDSFTFPDHRLVIPWRAPDGSVDTLQRRRIGGDDEPRYVFPPGVGPTFPFGIEAFAESGPDTPIALVEGALDVLAVRTLYRSSAVNRVPLGLPGVSGWRREWAELAAGRVVFLAFDADDAGERAVAPIADDLERAGAVRILRARPVGGKDWGSIVEGRT